MARKVLVTGVAGFIGSHLAKELLAQRYEVYGIDNLSTGKVENVPLGVEFRIISVADLTVEDLRGFDVVFHQAALPRVPISISDPVSTNYHNVSSFVKLLKTCVDAKVPRVVFASSSSVYGDQTVFPLKETMGLNPLSPYAVQKLACELYAKVFYKLFGIQIIGLRYFNVYGPGQDEKSPYSGIITLLKKWQKTGEPFTIFGDGTQSRDFTYVKDVVAANILAANADVGFGIFNIGAGKDTSLNELCRLVNPEREIVYLPSRPGDPQKTLADISEAQKWLGWTPKARIEEQIHSW